MALILREEDVRAVLTMSDTIAVVEAALREQRLDQTRNQPRRRVVLPEARGVLHVLSGYVPGQPGHPEQEGAGLVGLKAYTTIKGKARFVVLLYSGEDGRLLSMMEADWLGQMRTGAASGVATKYMARPDATTLGIIGTGQQARTQLLAVAAVRPLKSILAYGRDPARREAFAEEMTQRSGVQVRAVASTEEAVRAADVVVTMTTAREPVVREGWLRRGTHVNAAGSNWATRREVDDATVEQSAVVAVDSREQALLEAGDLVIAAASGHFDWACVVELGQVVAGQVNGRPSAEANTLFKSLGIALEDIATAGLVYKLARERGLGTELDILG